MNENRADNPPPDDSEQSDVSSNNKSDDDESDEVAQASKLAFIISNVSSIELVNRFLSKDEEYFKGLNKNIGGNKDDVIPDNYTAAAIIYRYFVSDHLPILVTV